VALDHVSGPLSGIAHCGGQACSWMHSRPTLIATCSLCCPLQPHSEAWVRRARGERLLPPAPRRICAPPERGGG